MNLKATDPNVIMMALLSSPVGLMLVVWWLKGQLKKLEKINIILLEISYIKEKLLEFKVNQERQEKTREEMIVAKSEMKTQWLRIDEISRLIRPREL